MFLYTILPKLLNMSLTASVVILFVLLLRLLLKKAPKVISYALWSIVLFRLLCPISIESGFSLFGLLDAPVTTNGTITSSISYIPDNIVREESLLEETNQIQPQEDRQTTISLKTPMAIAACVWMAGLFAMGLYTIASYMRLRRKLITASHLRDNIYLADEIPSPFVFGLFRPKIYLPSFLDEQEQPYIILHEQHHIRRLDHIVKALAFIALCVHWFNPLVWAAFFLASKDMEMSCDEAVIQKMGTGVLSNYAASLLSLATGKHSLTGMPLAFGEGDTKGRIRNLANWKSPKRILFVIAGLLVILAAVILVPNPSSVRLSKLVIDEVDMNTVLADIESMSVQYQDDLLICNEETSNRFVTALNKIKIQKKPVSQSRAENRSRSFTIIINDRLQLCFSDDFSEIWIDNGVKPSFSYPIINPEFTKELLMDSDFSQGTNETRVQVWFDYYNNDEMQWDGRQEINLDGFPRITFRWTPDKVEAVLEDGKIIPLYTGMPIWNVFFTDLTGDELPELCSTLTIGSGIGDNRIIIYDYTNGASYSLEDRMEYDYSLSMENGQLVVTKQVFSYNKTGEVIEKGYLAFVDSTIQIISIE